MARRKLQRWEVVKYWLRVLKASGAESWELIWGEFRWRSILISVITFLAASLLQFWWLGWHATSDNVKILLTSLGASIALFLVFLLFAMAKKPCELQNDAIDQISSLSAQLANKNITRKPRLLWSVFQFPTVKWDDSGIWREQWSEPRQKAFVLHFANLPYDDDKKGVPANGVRAQILWQYKNGAPGPVFFPAAWVDEPCGKVDIPVSWSKKLLIGIKSGTTSGYYWNGYSNPRIEPTDQHCLDGQMVPNDGTLSIKLVGDSGEVWYEGKWEWVEDLQYAHPQIRQLL
jgi:hypothetical protein